MIFDELHRPLNIYKSNYWNDKIKRQQIDYYMYVFFK